jgi:hypothetical protein
MRGTAKMSRQECANFQDTLLAPEIGVGHFKLQVIEV